MHHHHNNQSLTNSNLRLIIRLSNHQKHQNHNESSTKPSPKNFTSNTPLSTPATNNDWISIVNFKNLIININPQHVDVGGHFIGKSKLQKQKAHHWMHICQSSDCDVIADCSPRAPSLERRVGLRYRRVPQRQQKYDHVGMSHNHIDGDGRWWWS